MGNIQTYTNLLNRNYVNETNLKDIEDFIRETIDNSINKSINRYEIQQSNNKYKILYEDLLQRHQKLKEEYYKMEFERDLIQNIYNNEINNDNLVTIFPEKSLFFNFITFSAISF